jgi:serine/threonine-protein kinase HipA
MPDEILTLAEVAQLLQVADKTVYNRQITQLSRVILQPGVDLDEGTCSIDLLEAASVYYALTLVQARGIIREVARTTALWRDVAREAGARAAEISRMASAFEHTELQQALAL